LLEELKLKLAAAGGGSEMNIHIIGGLPELPGTNVIMPHMNGVNGQGHELNGHGPVIDADKPAIESVPANPPDPELVIANVTRF
jgi:hypothetical protein